MKKIVITLFMIILLPISVYAVKSPQEVKTLTKIAPFPEAKLGYTRYAINVPALSNEDNVRIELLIGKDMNVDCNIHRLGGTIKQHELTGWGYSYYVVEKANGDISTRMGCPAGSNRNEFVTMNHNVDWLRYNSRLPIVVYVPSDLQVKYRIWKLNEKVLSASME